MKRCIECGTTTVKNPQKHWFKGPTCDRCHRRQKYNEPDSPKKAYEFKYRKEHHAVLKEKAAMYVATRSKSDLNFYLKRLLRRRITEACKRTTKTGSAVSDLGCSVDELRLYLESKFLPGMTWENRGEWQVDHIKPLASFDLTDPVQFAAACHFSNLQPLWAKDNRVKSDKYD